MNKANVQSFRSLRMQLMPLLNKDANKLLKEVESELSLVEIPKPREARVLTHEERVARYMIPTNKKAPAATNS